MAWQKFRGVVNELNRHRNCVGTSVNRGQLLRVYLVRRKVIESDFVSRLWVSSLQFTSRDLTIVPSLHGATLGNSVMWTRKLLWFARVAAALGILAGLGTDKLLRAGEKAASKQDIKPAVSLPITRVVLFNSGVGYFSRSGEVVDDSRVDLMFPEQDINDLLKSMVLEDFNNGRIAAVSYDSREPIARTLSSFAINLNGNPTFAGIISQMRGERVDVVLSPGFPNQGGSSLVP